MPRLPPYSTGAESEAQPTCRREHAAGTLRDLCTVSPCGTEAGQGKAVESSQLKSPQTVCGVSTRTRKACFCSELEGCRVCCVV